jgi:predicted phosphohydrolase
MGKKHDVTRGPFDGHFAKSREGVGFAGDGCGQVGRCGHAEAVDANHSMPGIRCVLISDTHGLARRARLPRGKILIHAGDLSMAGAVTQIQDELDWFSSTPYEHKIVIAGNHGFAFQDERRNELDTSGVIYLQDSGANVLGLSFWGSPWQPWFYDWAFNFPRDGPELAARWALIPTHTDVLVTHGPPQGTLDATVRGDLAGCNDLQQALRRIRPRLHAFGHIHEAYGRQVLDGTTYVNAAICDQSYTPANSAVVVDP